MRSKSILQPYRYHQYMGMSLSALRQHHAFVLANPYWPDKSERLAFIEREIAIASRRVIDAHRAAG